MSNQQPPNTFLSAPQPGGDPFAPDVVDEQIAARLGTVGAHGRDARETRLVRALASVYLLPPEAEQALPRAYARIHTAQVPSRQSHGPSGGYSSPSAPTRPGSGSTPTSKPPSPRQGPNRGLWAGIAAAVVVALLVGLFARLLSGRNPASPPPAPTLPIATTQPTLTATTQPSVAPGTGWTAMPGLTGLTGLTGTQGQNIVPSIAPTDVTAAYAFTFGTPSCKGCAQTTPLLERTEDGGKSWQPMTMPSQLKGINYADGNAIAFPVMVSPVDAHLIFVTVSVMPNQCPVPTTNGGCLVTFRSADAGQSWQMLSFPVPGALEGAPVAMPNALQVVTESGGSQHLYATINTEVPATSGTMPSARLVVSTDDGQTWKIVDSALASKNQGIAAYAVVTPGPQGDSIYALTEPVNGGSETYSPTYQLWSSHDGGATWTQGTLPTSNPHTFLAARTDGYGTLYLDGDAVQSSGAPIQVFASTDGGAHWTASPTSGLPGGAQLGDLCGTVTSGTGTISILEFALDDTSNGASFYTWSVGSPGWTYVAPPPVAGADPGGDPPVVVSALGGQQQIVEVYGDTSGNHVARHAIS